MLISLKNKYTLKVGDFSFKCVIGKNGISRNKIEGDKKTPKGLFNIENLYFRKDRIKKIQSKLKSIPISKSMGWCDDINNKKKYNKLMQVNKKLTRKLFRKDKSTLLIQLNIITKKEY